MTHKWDGICKTPLGTFTARPASDGSHLLLRVVSVSNSGKLTLPVRELWCKLEGKALSDELNFSIFQGHARDHGEEESNNTIAEANEEMCSGLPWLRSLNWSPPDDVAGTGQWYVTCLVKASPSIFKKVKSRSGQVYYKLHEANLRAWLANGGGDVEELDDEEDYWCLTHNSSDEGPDKTVKKKLPPPDSDEDDGEGNDYYEEQPFGFDEDDQPLDEDDDDEPSEPVDKDPTSAEVNDDAESLKPVDNVQIYDSDDLDDDTEDGGVRLSPDQMKPARMFNFTLVGCEAEADAGYDGDA